MATLATEDFAGTGALSASWTSVTAGWTRSSNVGVATNTGENAARYTGTAAPNDQWAQATIGASVNPNVDEGLGPCVRFGAGGDRYLLQAGGTDTRIYKIISGAFTQLGTTGPSVATGDVVYLEIQGTTLVAKKNGSVICGSPTDASLASGSAGIFGYSTGANTLDDFSFGDFTGAGVTSYHSNLGDRRNRPGRGPYSLGRMFRPVVDGFTNIVNPDVTVALTGVGATGSVGSVTPSMSIALTGNAGTSAAGTIAPSTTRALTGAAGTGSPGSLTSSTALGLTGSNATGAAGTVTLSTDRAITGNAGTTAAGTIAPSITIGTTGVAGTGGVGTVSAQSGGNVTVALTGAAGTAGVGSIAPATSAALTGIAGTSGIGSLTAAKALGLSGASVTIGLGSLASQRSLVITGVGSIAALGDLTPSLAGNVTVSLTGVSLTASVGSVANGPPVASSGQTATVYGSITITVHG